jgi:hypothetical protein
VITANQQACTANSTTSEMSAMRPNSVLNGLPRPDRLRLQTRAAAARPEPMWTRWSPRES